MDACSVPTLTVLRTSSNIPEATRLRSSEVFAYVGLSQNLTDLKEKNASTTLIRSKTSNPVPLPNENLRQVKESNEVELERRSSTLLVNTVGIKFEAFPEVCDTPDKIPRNTLEASRDFE